MIFLTGSSGFIGSSIISNFGRDQIKVSSKGYETQFNDASVVIHLAGKTQGPKNDLNPDEYYQVNSELTKLIFDSFLESKAKVFIFLSSVKAVSDVLEECLTEQHYPNPTSHYGKSKLLAENYIFSKTIPEDKLIYILRPCMVHGPGNKGNLNLLFKLVSKNIPWPLGAFENQRSYCSIDNLIFIIKELIDSEKIPSGIYNVADNESISTNEIIELIARSQNRKPKIFKISKVFVKIISVIGDKFSLPLNSISLQKLTDSFVVSNIKIKNAIGKPLPISSREGLLKTFKSFNS
jgi:nucleoside-diphosphate-sugar epimerase